MKVAIANRGEVAVRVIRACQELGYTTVLLASTPDLRTLAARITDQVIELGGNEVFQNYLDIQKVVAAAKNAGCNAIHPGFGFLSENAQFADVVKKAGMIFIGPSGDVIRKLGDKVSAKEIAARAGVPTVPAYTGADQAPSELLEHAKKIGFPAIIKAVSGGGGKGMKVCRQESEFVELCESAQREAQTSFGSSRVFVEKYLEGPGHIEIQIFGDQHGNVVHLFERDCTVQRRHQKIIEESPSPALDGKLRKKIGEAAVKLAKTAGYFNAGTVEFLLDQKGHFFFMEMNTRLQVEHPVTELVVGIDLVKLQFAVACGEKIPFSQDEISQRGHAFEVRLYAEDPANGFLPSIGPLLALELPEGPGRRFDFGLETGDEMTPFYDPMIGKLICWSENRARNIERMKSVLNDTMVFGLQTNIEFIKSVFTQKDFIEGRVDTGFIEKNYPEGFSNPPLSTTQTKFVELVRAKAPQALQQVSESQIRGPDPFSPWQMAGGWRIVT